MAFADGTVPTNIPLPFGEIIIGDFISHFQNAVGRSVLLDEYSQRAIVNFDHNWRVEISHFQGRSPLLQDFQTSVNDYEFRLAHRVDDWHDTRRTDKPGRNLYFWVSWKRWNSNSVNDAVLQEAERDEGLGLGFTRDPERTGLSYFYIFGLYPSVRSSLASQKNAFTINIGPTFNLTSGIAMNVGYRYQAILTDSHRGRAQEQGLTFGLSGLF